LIFDLIFSLDLRFFKHFFFVFKDFHVLLTVQIERVDFWNSAVLSKKT